jgi:hypothetical protein
MTTSTLHDLTLIAALPRTAGLGASLCLEPARKALQDARRAAVIPARGWPPKKAPRPADPAAVLARACSAVDTAETLLAEAPTFTARRHILCDGERMELRGILYDFFPDGGTTKLQGVTVRTGQWRAVARVKKP